MAQKPKKKAPEVETTGHSWDGIEELNNPLPKWWLWCLYACIVWGIWYTIAYPAWPGIKGATAGYLGYSTRAEVAQDIAEVNARNADINAQLASADLAVIDQDETLKTYATSAGAAVFKTWCAQCHGSGAAGSKGYPNLQDDDWLWGGNLDEIYQTVAHGIRTDTDEDSRYSEMPAFGQDYLEKPQIEAVVNYVMSLSDTPKDASLVSEGAEIFASDCASCHAEDATGDREQGAPNLADAIWLYGGDYDSLKETVTYARFGVMPDWNERLTEAQLRAVTTYVHQLGGGE